MSDNGTPERGRTPKGKLRPRTLNAKEGFLLRKELDASRSDILSSRPLRSKLAEEMSTRLGFLVVEQNVSRALRDLDMQYHPAVAGCGGRSNRLTRCEENLQGLLAGVTDLSAKLETVLATHKTLGAGQQALPVAVVSRLTSLEVQRDGDRRCLAKLSDRLSAVEQGLNALLTQLGAAAPSS